MIRASLIAAPLILAVSACSGPAPVDDAFSADGQVIALGGGSGGTARACVSCHGLKGEGDGNLVPRLAGIDQGYLARQMRFYADGQRANAQMAAVAKSLTEAEQEKVLAYYARLAPPPASPCPTPPSRAALLYQQGDPRRGIASCASCHGAAGEGRPGNPPLSGQPATYLARQLSDWREGKRYGDPLMAMTAIARALKPAELAALSAYAAALPGDARYSAPPAKCPPARRAGPRNGA